MNTWIDQEVSTRSPETFGSRQLRRIIGMGKFFAKTHAYRLNQKFPGGLVATVLFIEAYVPIDGRDDEAFRETLRAISCRSKHSPAYANGVQVSDAKDTDRIGRLVDEAKASLVELDKLDAGDAAESDARKACKKVFRHSFFDEVVMEAASNALASLERKSALVGAGPAAPFVASQAAAALSDEARAERLESAVRARNESGGGGKPWSN